MLDIGGDRGALVIYTSEDLLGQEIEIRPHDGEWTGLHTAVRARHMGEVTRYAGVFGSLSAGLYDLRVRLLDGVHSHGSHSHAGHCHEGHPHDEVDAHGARPRVLETTASEPAAVMVKPATVVETTLRP